MAAFEFVALDQAGRQQKGVLEGDSARQVRQQLRDRHWTPLDVVQVRQLQGHASGWMKRRQHISATDLALFTRQLATLVRSAVPLDEALNALAQQTDKQRIKSLVLAVRARVTEGHGLSAALAEYPGVFSTMYRATVAAGEQSGHLDVVLERLADYAENSQMIGQKVMLALLYPVILSLVAMVAVMFLLAYVVPQVVEVFAGMGQQLPLLTRILISISDFIRQWWMALLLLVLIALVSGYNLMRVPKFRFAWHVMILRLPLVARLVRGVNIARFARTFGMLVASNVPVLEALQISGQVMSNLPLRERVELATRRVREGASLHTALQGGGEFPPMMLHLIANGELSGKLEQMLERAAEAQERELETLRAALLGIFEPLVILVMGGLVLVIVLAILLPILDLNQLVH